MNKNNSSNTDDFDLSDYTREEKLSWLGGYDIWNLRAIPGVTTDRIPSERTNNRGRSGSNNSVPREEPPKTSLLLADGPHGVRKPISDLTLQEAHPATCFPSACSSACSWNPGLLETMGRALAKECEHYGVHVLLGPGVNLKRHPCGGRNHEYFSEDPYLTGVLAESYIHGVQESGSVGACIKHFALNNQESNRFIVDVAVDERTMRELYLPAFERSLCSDDETAVPKLVMAAYNKVNGTYCCEHEYLLGSILRGEWKYDGVVVSDWGAILNRAASIKAGMDLEMPGTPLRGAFDEEVLEECESEAGGGSDRSDDEEKQFIARRSNELETAIDECASRVVRLIADLHPGEKEIPAESNSSSTTDGIAVRELFASHDRLAREIARECIVLLQNKDDFLPLSKENAFREGKTKIGLVGAFANDSPRYQGMGSAHVTPTKVTSVYDAMESLFGIIEHGPGSVIPFAKGYDPDADDDNVQQSLIDEAVSIAKRRDLDTLVVCVGLPEISESEGFDRKHIRLPKQHISLVEALLEVHPNVVVVLSNGGIAEIPQSFVDGAKAVLDGFLLGQAGGHALVDVLFGAVSPSGRLPETIPLVPDTDVPAANYFPGTQERVEYREGLDVGYRYYDTAGIPVRFPFGHGLHYTRFEYENLKVSVEQDEAASKRVRVSLDVRNTGESFSKASMEVVQLYVRPLNAPVYRPCHELKGFDKVEIAPGASAKVEFVLDERAFSYYDIGHRDWVVEKNGFEIRVGASSRDIRLTEALDFSTGKEASELAKISYPPTVGQRLPLEGKRLVVDSDVFAKRFGKLNPEATRAEQSNTINNKTKTIVTRNTLLIDAANASMVANALFMITWMVAKREVKPGPTMKRELRCIRENLCNIPLRSLVVFSKGNMNFRTLDVLIHLMNGKYRKALKRLFQRSKTAAKAKRRKERN